MKARQKETLLDNLPGYPDNVKRTSKGTFYAGLPVARFRKRIPPFLDLIAPYPALKRFIAKVWVVGFGILFFVLFVIL